MSGGKRLLVVVGLVLHVALLPFFVASGLVVPWYVVPVLIGVWAVALAVAIGNRERPWVVVAAPAAALAVLVGVVSAGEALFDWTA